MLVDRIRFIVQLICSVLPCYWWALSSLQGCLEAYINDDTCDDVDDNDSSIMASYHRSIYHPSHRQCSDTRGCVYFAILLGCLSYSHRIILIWFIMILMDTTLSSGSHFIDAPLFIYMVRLVRARSIYLLLHYSYWYSRCNHYHYSFIMDMVYRIDVYHLLFGTYNLNMVALTIRLTCSYIRRM